MKVRNRNPAAGIARATVIQAEKSRQTYITTVRARYGTTDVARSKRLWGSEGRSCGAIDSRQGCRLESESRLGAAAVSCERAVTGRQCTHVFLKAPKRGLRRIGMAGFNAPQSALRHLARSLGSG